MAGGVRTTLLKFLTGISHLWTAVITILYCCADFWLVSQTLVHIPTGVAYAIWSGGEIALSALRTGGWLMGKGSMSLPLWVWPWYAPREVANSGSTNTISTTVPENGAAAATATNAVKNVNVVFRTLLSSHKTPLVVQAKSGAWRLHQANLIGFALRKSSVTKLDCQKDHILSGC